MREVNPLYVALSVGIGVVATYEGWPLFLTVIAYGCLLYALRTVPLRTIVFYNSIVILMSVYVSFIHLPHPYPITEREATYTLVGTNTVQVDGDRLRGFFHHRGARLYVTYRIQTQEERDELASFIWQDRIWRVSGMIVEPSPPAHDYAFSMARYLKMYNASGLLRVERSLETSVQPSWRATIEKWRHQVRHRIERLFPPSMHWEAKALLIGDKQDMTTEWNERLQILGISHLLAISGLHVSLLALFVRELLYRMMVTIETTDWIVFGGLPFYAFLAGASPSVLRATLMAMIVLFVTRRQAIVDPFTALAWSAVVLLVWQPFMLYIPGFQLSYGAALTIIVSGSLLRRARTVNLQLFLITLLTQLTLYPILLYHFYEVSISSVVTNLVYVPLYSFFILPAYVMLLCSSYVSWSFAQWGVQAFSVVQSFVAEGTTMLATIPYQMWNGGAIHPVVATLLTLSIAYACLLYERSRFRLATILVVVPILGLTLRPYVSPHVHLTFLDVGQGDSTVIQLPHRRAVYVVDTGGLLRYEREGEEWREPKEPYEVGRQVVVPYLKATQRTTIDALMITHADSDHMEAADELLDRIRIQQIVYPNGSDNKELMASLLQRARERSIPLVPIERPIAWQVGDVQLQFIWPDGASTIQEENDRSLVLQLSYGAQHALFMGDVERWGEEQLAERYRRLRGYYVLKVGHHGSRTSTTERWLDVVRPNEAVISAGRHNRYGHPHREVVERLEARDIPIRSTAEEGTIHYIFKK